MTSIPFKDHPEGGRFSEVFRSGSIVTTESGLTRTALTHIYFSLDRGEVSRFHRVTSDEVWNLYEGPGIRIYTWDGSDSPPVCTELSTSTGEYCCIVRAGYWQAAEPIGESVLVGCSVGPGFEFDDFELIDPDSDPARLILEKDPGLEKFVI